MSAIQRATGMQDVLPEDRRYWDLIIDTAKDLATRYGYLRVDVPVIEYTDLFSRGVGTASDFFVNKEMYTIQESDSSSITLRPEFTAGLVRAYIENGMASWTQPVKLYSIGPLFRRERPQAGRFRQHTQFNPEILGETDPAADLEIMLLAMNLHRNLGYKELKFQLNSTGCPECKPAYVELLSNYLEDHMDRLAEVDKERMRRNPLRVLDSKEPGMDLILEGAPHIADHLCDDCRDHFAELRRMLDIVGQSYEINFRLVRGIDYYTKTVFELWDQSIGAQAALCGGGRYDGLAEAIGGRPTPGVGAGIGVDRIALGLKMQAVQPPEVIGPKVFVAHFGGQTKSAAVKLCFDLREAALGCRLAFARNRRSMKSQLREANRHQAHFVIILGEEEVVNDTATVRDMVEGKQIEVAMKDLVEWLVKAIGT